jgi:hypothetical protein
LYVNHQWYLRNSVQPKLIISIPKPRGNHFTTNMQENFHFNEVFAHEILYLCKSKLSHAYAVMPAFYTHNVKPPHLRACIFRHARTLLQ